MNSTPTTGRHANREFERELREMNDALLVSSVHQHEMIEQEQKSRAAILESSDDAIIVTDLNSMITSWNKGAETIFGYTASEIVGTSIRRLIPDDRQEEENYILGVIKRGERVEHFETIRQAKDGRPIELTVTASPVKDTTGKIINLAMVARDTTAAKQVQVALRESQQVIGLTLAAAHIGHWDLNLVTNIATRSVQHDRIFGYEELLPAWSYDWFLKHVHPEDRKDVDRLFHAVVAAKTKWDFECRIIRRDGALRWIWAFGNVFTDVAGEAVRMLGMVSDITERKRTEAERESLYKQVLERREELRILSQQLIHAQEEERRRMAEELHDEIGQVLTAVSISLERANRTVNEAGWEWLDESRAVIRQACEQVRRTSLNLRPPMLDDIGLESALRWFVDRQVNATGLEIDLVSSLGDKRVSPELETTCFRIVQEALTNVARHAGARTVRIDLARKDCDLFLLVQDDGIGFDVATSRQRATTGGSFGLRGMEERTRLLGGEFKIESASGTGTVMCARLPLLA